MAYQAVWSQAFVQYTASSPNNTFLVPAGYTAVIRQISAVQDIGVYDASVAIRDSTEAPYITIWYEASVGEFVTAAAVGRWVVPAGGEIEVLFTKVGDAPNFYVGGYLLRNSGS